MSRTLPVLSMGLVLVLLAVAAGYGLIRVVALPIVRTQGCLCGSGLPRWLW